MLGHGHNRIALFCAIHDNLLLVTTLLESNTVQSGYEYTDFHNSTDDLIY